MVSRNQCHSIKCAGRKDSLQQCKIKAAGFLGFTAGEHSVSFCSGFNSIDFFFKFTEVK